MATNGNDQGDPRDEVDRKAGAPAGGRAKPAPQQEVIGPLDSLAKSAIDVGVMQMEMALAMEHALRHPRNIEVVIKQIRQMALVTDAAASRCVYALPRADKAIIGPSIGLATIAASAWMHCRDEGWWIRTDRAEKVVVCGGAFYDLQTNRRTGATVTRRISGKNGGIYSDDMIAVTIQAATAIAQRNAILKGVPGPIWRPVYEEALVVVRGTVETLPERRRTMIAAFANFGVKPERVLAALGAREEKEITLDHMVMLRGMYQQLADEAITAEEMFDPRRMTGRGFEGMENPLADEIEEEAAQGGKAAPPAARSRPAATRAAEPEKNARASPAAGHGPVQDEPEAESEDDKPTPKPRKAAAEPEKPKIATPEEYEAHATAWIAASTRETTSASAFDDRWRAEKPMRSALGVMEDILDRLLAAKNAKLAELKGG